MCAGEPMENHANSLKPAVTQSPAGDDGSITLPPSLWDALEGEAESQVRTSSQQLEWILKARYEKSLPLLSRLSVVPALADTEMLTAQLVSSAQAVMLILEEKFLVRWKAKDGRVYSKVLSLESVRQVFAQSK